LRRAWAWLPVEPELPEPFDDEFELFDVFEEAPEAVPPPRVERTWPSTEVIPFAGELEVVEVPLEPPPELVVVVLGVVVAGAEVVVVGVVEAVVVLVSSAPAADALSLHTGVLGPLSPGGAPPGSGTHAPGFDGSGSLTPGWFGPSQA
jgi:hypothetical protein